MCYVSLNVFYKLVAIIADDRHCRLIKVYSNLASGLPT